MTLTPTATPFGYAAPMYRENGMEGTIPIPPRSKRLNLRGYTGDEGVMPTDAEVMAWIQAKADHNVAWRLPHGFLGLDFDHYDGKEGGATKAELEAKFGPLPPTPISSARTDGLSGIRIYTVPKHLRFKTAPGPGFEVLQFRHRYAMVYPSINPKTDTTYRWVPAGGDLTDPTVSDYIPSLDDFAELPAAWVEYLSEGHDDGPRLTRSDVNVDEWLGGLLDGDPCSDVTEALDHARLALASGGSRYDAMVSGTMALVFRGHAGCPGVAHALMDLQDDYTEAVSGESERDDGEWLRSLHGAVEKVASAEVLDWEVCSRVIAERSAELLFDYTPAPKPSIWDERPILRHLHDFARGRGVAPLAVLGVALARIVAATPSNVVLPAIIGGDGTLNLFVAFVGKSGQGKGAAEAAAADAIDLSKMLDRISAEPIHTVNVGSGEGFVHQFVERKAGELRRIRDSVLFSIPEVDTLTALGNRQGATLMPTLRSAWSGEALGHSYADPSKALKVEARAYRCSLMLGVQPTKAGPLLEDADGGTPQRFLWVPVVDPDMPRKRPPAPEPKKWDRKFPSVQRYEMAVCEEAIDTIEEAHWLRSRGEGDPLDGHALYTRLKVAAALALLDKRLDVTADDWRLSGRIMSKSDATRAGVQRELRERATEANIGRAKAEAARAVVVAEEVDAQAVRRASQAVKNALGKKPDAWVSRKELRQSIAGRNKPNLDDALAALVLSGDIETEAVAGTSGAGSRYRLRS